MNRGAPLKTERAGPALTLSARTPAMLVHLRAQRSAEDGGGRDGWVDVDTHPRWRTAGDTAWAEVRELGLAVRPDDEERVIRSWRVAELAGVLLPTAADAVLSLGLHTARWLYVVDDRLDVAGSDLNDDPARRTAFLVSLAESLDSRPGNVPEPTADGGGDPVDPHVRYLRLLLRRADAVLPDDDSRLRFRSALRVCPPHEGRINAPPLPPRVRSPLAGDRLSATKGETDEKEEEEDRWERQTEDRARFVARKVRASGTLPFAVLMETALGLRGVPVRRPNVARTTELFSLLVAFSNDLFSYPKELDAASAQNNAIDFFMRRDSLSADAAVDRLIDELDALWAEFGAAVRAPTSGPADRSACAARGTFDDPPPGRSVQPLPENREDDMKVATYVRGLARLVDAFSVWQLRSERYFHRSHLFAPLRRSGD